MKSGPKGSTIHNEMGFEILTQQMEDGVGGFMIKTVFFSI